ncbi:glutamate--tRNA ligase [Rosettibacter firmus]|uniref:glutamate--tRNA ligase n=1 Tax=Rosettibacter firmus TaxID=3111522 RepID=UPI00336BDA97
MENIRVRFAPSPTGYLHVGGLRTALYNYLFARKNNGKFILRIEDTDRSRYVEGAVENLIASLKWCGLDYDEGPDIGGDYGPYMQSQRLDIYKQHAEELIKKGHAYYCFCSPERLAALREEQSRLKVPQIKYDKHCLKLSPQEVQNKIENGEPYVIRLNVPANQTVRFYDIIRGDVEFDTNIIDDQILIKSDGYPTYHLANVVDDHLMKISHVIRGEEWLSSTPKHVLLYDYFGWEKPQFAHLPLLLNPDRSKLSKRQGDVAVEEYRAKGYLKEALINFVALLGWNAGDDREFYYLNELIEKFSLEGVNKSGAVFDLNKLIWLNGEHIRKKTVDELLPLLKDELKKSKYASNNFSDEYLKLVISAMQERIDFVHEIITKSYYFFERPTSYEEKAIQKNWKPETTEHLKLLIETFEKLNNPTKEDYENALNSVAEKLQINKGKLIHPLRLALSGTSAGPGIFDLLYILGKEEVIIRIKNAIQSLA